MDRTSFDIRAILTPAVIVASLGYFVDIYDLVLFGVVRQPSLQALGLTGQVQANTGIFLLNTQMAGMLVGGVIFGILGDKKGRLSLLFGSILLYSLATLANAFVHTVPPYAVCRFLAGVGLAGELGGGVTLVSELLSKEHRGYGTTVVASVGVAGAVLAYWVSEGFNWRTAYIVGGVLGLLLLVLRVSVFESGMFRAIQNTGVSRGKFLSLFTSRKRFLRYLTCILIGLPSWYVVGVLVQQSPELAKALGVTGPVTAGKAVMYCYIGLIPGDVVSGLLSQYLHSRKKAVALFTALTVALVACYFVMRGISPKAFYALCFGLGFSIGYWAVFVTIAAEQFGTNLRATVATTVPNFVRGATVPITSSFVWAASYLGSIGGGLAVGAVCLALAIAGLIHLEETFGKDLNFIETL